MKKLLKWFKSLWSKKIGIEEKTGVWKTYVLNISNEIPKKALASTLHYSIKFKLLKFQCPCECGNVEMLNIEKAMDRKARQWSVFVDNGLLTLNGSVGSSFPCKSHYFIRENNIIYAHYI